MRTELYATISAILVAQDCPRCSWVNSRAIKLPKSDFSTLNILDECQSKAIPVGTNLNTIGIAGTSIATELNLKAIFETPSGAVTVAGRPDHILATPDGAAIVDRKTGGSKDSKTGEPKPLTDRHLGQLSLYKALIEHPTTSIAIPQVIADRYLHLPTNGGPLEITSTAILFMAPTESILSDTQVITFWQPEPIFASLESLPDPRRLISEWAEIQLAKTPPPSRPDCPNCSYYKAVDRIRQDLKSRKNT